MSRPQLWSRSSVEANAALEKKIEQLILQIEEGRCHLSMPRRLEEDRFED